MARAVVLRPGRACLAATAPASDMLTSRLPVCSRRSIGKEATAPGRRSSGAAQDEAEWPAMKPGRSQSDVAHLPSHLICGTALP